ncbi:unnamed protein product [Heligmosomoides polygyrus]|uniref:DNA-binding protein n=1 Tax=Heligmosomoides polygyrus TaxID=6339 RepID=A0A183FBM2_HELPZ|nr:unnamed protein product [Heligmosomoides polygyrus]
MSLKGAVRLTIQASKGTRYMRHKIGLFGMAGGEDVIVLGTNALKNGRRHQHKEGKAKKAAVRQQRSNAFKTVTVAQRLCLKPGETRDVSPRYDNMRQDGVLRSSSDILPETEGQGAQRQIQIHLTNSFAKAKNFREGEMVDTYEGTEMDERVAGKARAPKSTNSICGRQTVFAHPSRGSAMSKVDGDDVDHVKEVMGEVCAELTSGNGENILFVRGRFYGAEEAATTGQSCKSSRNSGRVSPKHFRDAGCRTSEADVCRAAST